MAAAALGCLARKVASAPPSQHPRFYSRLGRSSRPSLPRPPRRQPASSEKGQFSQDLKIAFIKSACTLLTVWAFGGQFYSFVVKPRFDELRDSLDALSREVKEVIRLKKEEDVRQANNMQTSGGREKDPRGHKLR